MKSFASLTAYVATTALVFATHLPGQNRSPEIDELQRRVAIIRSQLPQITALSDKYATFLGRDGSGRFLISRRIDPALFQEFLARAGGPPDTQDAELGSVSLPRWNNSGRKRDRC